MKYKQLYPGFELGLLCPFLMMITIALPKVHAQAHIYIYVYVCMYVSVWRGLFLKRF